MLPTIGWIRFLLVAAFLSLQPAVLGWLIHPAVGIAAGIFCFAFLIMLEILFPKSKNPKGK